MEECVERFFQFDRMILVQARNVEEKDLSNDLMEKLLGWAVLNDTIW
jgi:hypothetical protein